MFTCYYCGRRERERFHLAAHLHSAHRAEVRVRIETPPGYMAWNRLLGL